MKVKLIVGVSENNVIGNSNKLPWNIKEEMDHFRTSTTGNTIIMGRKTYESIGKPLPKRLSIVITRNTAVIDEPANRLLYATSVENAIEKAKLHQDEYPDAFIIGGTQIYNYALENALCDELIISRIPLMVEGDAFFGEIPNLYSKVGDEKRGTFTIEIYKKQE